MNLHNLREAQVRYENCKEKELNSREELYRLRSTFVRYFNHNKISIMQIDDYVAGVNLPQNGFNFCYGLERQLDGHEEAFQNIRQEIIQLLNSSKMKT